MPKVPLNGVEVFYQLHCSRCGTLEGEETTCGCHHKLHLLLIMGFQARGEAWRYNLDTLLSFKVPGDDQGEVLACWLDNRGVGETSHPKDKKAYSTKHMADDALALMDHIGWDKAHVFGHSMGGMIACKLASTAPERVQSLALLGVTGGNWQAIGSIVRKLPGLLKHHVMTARTAEQKARATLYCHFSRRWLKQVLAAP
mmetsp:Transcript_39442/g.111788  ORF Transcript_39442/g.111788 Transcript_39442/m.111788 type:complete len:199 (+) Transcript_39442:235-831(+)